jgi:uncharacterized phage protein gp47/JayE
MPIPQLAYVDSTGYHYADYPTVLAYYQAEYRTIYGSDIYLGADSQDGQWIAIQAQASYDLMALGAAVYNSFSPATSQSDALSRGVKINGISRRVATKSTADLAIVGQAGTVITRGIAEDVTGIKWDLPDIVTIPNTGIITVTATCQVIGFINAGSNTINSIYTPTRGWQTVTNPNPATAGAPVETDAELRARQTVSTALPSLSVLDGTLGAVASCVGVTKYAAYENDTSAIDSDGLPPHSISIVVEGGEVRDIAYAIAKKKTPGTNTYGTTSFTTYDSYGLPNTINFFRPTEASIFANVIISPLFGFTTGYVDDIKQSLVDYFNSLKIGQDVDFSRTFTPATLFSTPAGATFTVIYMAIAKFPDTLSSENVTILFNELPRSTLSNINVTVS